MHENRVDAIGANEAALDRVIKGRFLRPNGINFTFVRHPIIRKSPLNAAQVVPPVTDALSNGFRSPVWYLPYAKRERSGYLSYAAAGMRRRLHRYHPLTQLIAKIRKEREGLAAYESLGGATLLRNTSQRFPSVGQDAWDKTEQPTTIGAIGGVG